MNHRNLLLPTLLLGFCVAACAKAGGEPASDGNKAPAVASATITSATAAASAPAAGMDSANDSAPASEKTPSSSEDLDALPKTKGITQTFTTCMERADTDTIAKADCLTDERDRQDARLNRVYKTLIGLLKGSQREQIVQAQRAWIQLQEKDGAFEASIFDNLGQVGNLQGVENQMLRISERANRLENYTELVKIQQ
jgi:uncharacterized protein YecT (DUF1311 family)